MTDLGRLQFHPIKELSTLLKSINGNSFTNFFKLSNALKELNDLGEYKKGFASINSILSLMPSFTGSKDDIDNIARSLDGLSLSSAKTVLSLTDLDETTLALILKQAGLDEALAATTAAEIAAGNGAKLASVSFKTFGKSILTAAKGLATFLLTNPVGWAISATAAIVGLVKVVDWLTVSYEEAAESAQESRQAFQEASSELSSIESELKTTEDRIKELQSLGTLSLTEEAELDNLIKQNEQLKVRYELQKKIADSAGAKAASDANKALSTKSLNFDVVDSWTDGSLENETIIEETLRKIERANFLKEAIEDGEKRLLDFDIGTRQYNKINKGLEKSRTSYTDLEAEIGASVQEIQGYYDSLLDSEGNVRAGYEETAKACEGLFDTWTTEASKAAETVAKINTILSKNEFSGKKNELINFASSQTLDEFTKTVKSVEGLQSALSDARVSVEDFQQQLASFAETSLTTVEKHLKELRENLSEGLFDKFFDGKSNEEIEIFYRYINSGDIDISQWTEEDLKYNWEIAINGAEESIKTIEELKDSLTETSALFETISTGISESISGIGLSSDSIKQISTAFKKLDGYDSSKLFEKTSNGIHLNRVELEKLNKEYEESKKLEFQNKLEELTREYDEATLACKGLTKGQVGYQEAMSRVEGIEAQIEETKLLQAQYVGLTSAYNAFITAQSGGNERDSYETIASSYEEMKKLLTSGWYGDESLNKYLDLLLSDTARTGDAIKDFNKLTQKIKGSKFSLMDFFTEDKDGNLTSHGLYNFLDTVKAVMGKASDEYVKVGKNGAYSFDFTGDKIQKVADKLGMSVEAVQLLERAMIDAGFDVIFDNATESVKTLDEKISDAEEKLKKISEAKGIEYKPIQIDIAATDIDAEISKAKSLISEINSSNVNIEVKDAQLESASLKLDALIQRKLQLNQPTFMKLDISQVSEGAKEMLGALQDYQKAVNDLEYHKIIGDFDDSQIINAEKNIDNLIQKIFDINKNSDIDFGIDINSDNYDTFAQKVKENEINIPLAGDATALKDNISNAIKSAIDGVEITWEGLFGKEHTITINAQANTTQAQNDVQNFTDKANSVPSNVNTKVSADTSTAENNVQNFTNKANSVPSKVNTTVTASTSTAESSIQRVLNLLRSIVNRVWTAIVGSSGGVKVNGTAHHRGTAFAKGNWGTKNSGDALGGELGQELIVRDGRFFTIGDDSAEFFHYKKGDIIFNAEQTRQIFKNGKITHGSGRGKAFATGTAFDIGSTTNSRPSSSATSVSNSSSSSKSSSKSSSSENEPKSFDWIEISISRLERAIDNLAKTANNAFKSLTKRNNAITKEIAQVSSEISLQQSAYNRYIQEANSVGLSSSLAAKVRDGSIDISEYNEETSELISKYQTWYEKALECSDAIDDLHESLAKLYKDNFDNVKTDFDNQLALYEHLTNTYNNGIDELEESGYLASKKYYSALLSVEEQNITVLNKELADLEKAFSEAMASGEIDEYSEEWYDFQTTMNGVKEEIQEANTELIKLSNSMRTIDWDRFDYLQDNISQITSESDFMIDLMGYSDLYDKQGQLNDKGMATMGLHGVNYNVYMNQADQYAKEINRINKEIAENPYDTELLKRREELLELQRDSILAAEDEKQAMIDLVEEGIQAELDSLKELIDTYNDALDSAKDLYDYQKRVAEHTEEISSLKKQLSAYAGDDSEENQAKLQKLRNELKTAEEDLQETEYDKYISDQKKLLDNIYTEYETVLNQRMDDIDATLDEMIDSINDNSASINNTISDMSDSVGYTLTDNMQSIWDNSISGVITKYGDGFSEKLTNVNTVLSSIQSSIAKLTGESENKATETVSKATTTTTPTKPTTTNTAKPTTSTSGGDGEAKVGDKVTFSSGKYYNSSDGLAPSGSQNLNKSVYITKINTAEWATHPYHISTGNKLGKGDLGWVKLNQLKGYKTGGIADYTGLAWLDGTPQKPETILNAEDSQNFIALTETLREISNNGLLSAQKGYFDSPYLDKAVSHNLIDISDRISALRKQPSNIDNSKGDIYVNIDIEKVEDYNDFVSKLQKDKNFSAMIRDETINLVNGGSRLAKNKYKW